MSGRPSSLLARRTANFDSSSHRTSSRRYTIHYHRLPAHAGPDHSECSGCQRFRLSSHSMRISRSGGRVGASGYADENPPDAQSGARDRGNRSDDVRRADHAFAAGGGRSRSFFGTQVFETVIPRNVRLAEAPSHGKPIIFYDIHSRGAEAYIQLAREVMPMARNALGRGLGALIREPEPPPAPSYRASRRGHAQIRSAPVSAGPQHGRYRSD